MTHETIQYREKIKTAYEQKILKRTYTYALPFLSIITYENGDITPQTRVSEASEMNQVYQDAHWQASV